MGKLFGTDGIRGVANIEPMTVETIMKIGRAAAFVFKKDNRRHQIVIGKDTRLSNYLFESALVAGICSMGVDVLLVGPLPTPGIAFITRSLRADAGIVISASHNPYEDNGIKFFSADGYKLPDDIENRIEELIFSGEIDSIRPTADDIGKAYRISDAVGRYIEFVKTSFPKGLTLDGIKIVLDCANGATYKVAPRVYKELGAEVIVYNNEPDGTNINKYCGSLHPEVIRKGVIEHKADIGISHDGDGDRVILADEESIEVDGDHIMGMCAIQMLEENRLNNNTVVTTVMSNMGFELAMQKMGIKVIRTKVGDRYVMEEMAKGGYNLGGEQSGHIIFSDHNTTGDGIITALQVLSLMKKTGQKLSELASCVKKLPQVLINVEVKEKKKIEDMPDVKNAIDEVQSKLNGNGRLLVRYSGTELLMRIMAEGPKEKEVRDLAEFVANKVRKEVGM